MAQTGYTPIQLYRTTTAAATPLAANLNEGELAINYNTADMSVWALNTGGSVVRLMNNPAGLKYPTVDGTSNQVLKTDGAGLLSWVTTVLSGGALGTPTSGTLTNCTGLPISTGVSGLGTNVATFLQTPSSANLAAALTDETGTAGKVVFDTNPTFPAQINLTANSGYNIYASGTADNYLAGSLGIGGVPFAGVAFRIQKTLTGTTTAYAQYVDSAIQTDVTSAFLINTGPTQIAGGALSGLTHMYVEQGTLSGTVTNQFGYRTSATLTGATNNYGFYGGIASGANRYNLFVAGTADNYLAGSLGIGTATPSVKLHLGGRDANLTQAILTNGVGDQNFQLCVLNGASGSTAGVNQASIALAYSGTGYAAKVNFLRGSGATDGYITFETDSVERARIAPSGNVGIGTSSPDASAILDAQSTTKGVRFPNMTTTQKNAVSSPAAGLVVFDTTLSKLCVYSGAAWQTITSV